MSGGHRCNWRCYDGYSHAEPYGQTPPSDAGESAEETAPEQVASSGGGLVTGECGATDGFGLLENSKLYGEQYGQCNLPAGHDGDWHREIRDGVLWAEWRGPAPGERCPICGKDGSEH